MGKVKEDILKDRHKEKAIEIIENMMKNGAWGSVIFVFENGYIRHSEEKKTEKKVWE